MTIRLRLSTGRARRLRSVLVVALFGAGAIAAVALVSGANTIRPLPRVERPDVTPAAVVAAATVATDTPRPDNVQQTAAPTPEPTDFPARQPVDLPPEPVIDVVPSAHPAPPRPSAAPTDGGHTAEVELLKAVVIVGPTDDETALNLERGELFAQRAEANGMDVRRVYFPHATWKNVLANIQGANLVAYFGHGNGWPSIYGNFQEGTKNGLGLDTSDGGTASETTYYGADRIRQSIKLAPNAVVVLSHLCYSAGNAEPGLPLPDEELAWQRVDNYASGFLSVGARAVFAYGTGSAAAIVDGLFAHDRTMDDIFMTRGRKRQPYYGFVGWQDRYFDALRMPGYRSHLDPGKVEGYLRAITGDLEMTTTEWATGEVVGSRTPQR